MMTFGIGVLALAAAALGVVWALGDFYEVDFN